MPQKEFQHRKIISAEVSGELLNAIPKITHHYGTVFPIFRPALTRLVAKQLKPERTFKLGKIAMFQISTTSALSELFLLYTFVSCKVHQEPIMVYRVYSR